MTTSLIINGDARALPFADASAQCCVTSPPYYGLRDYGVDGQIGLEQTPAEYVAQSVAAMREVWRVLRDDGVLWLNLGDSYANDGKWGGTTGGKHAKGLHGQPVGRIKHQTGAKPKDLIGIPWRVAFALQDAGWYLRSDIIWAKPNPMPESVTDRPTRAHEYVFLLAKRERYFYDAEAVAEAKAPSTVSDPRMNGNGHRRERGYPGARSNGGTNLGGPDGCRNARSVWSIATAPYSGAHFATMPPELARRCILAGSRPGDVVLDPFAGSGTTGKVALENGRHFVGVELNPAYIGLAHERTTVTPSMFSMASTGGDA